MSTPVSNSVSTTSFNPLSTGLGKYVADGVKWGGAFGTGVTLTYSFPSGTASFITGYEEFQSWYALTAAEQSAAVSALATWSAVAKITFNKVADNSSVVGDLRFAMCDMNDFAHAYLPHSHPSGGDVWFGHNDWNDDGGSVSKGDYDFLTIIHEIGHALGLKHTFESPNVTPVAQDNMFYSVMSYTAAKFPNDNYATFFPTTPMYYDLAAIQTMYGRNTSHNAGNTTYTFNDGTRYFQTIDDASGTDTIVFNGTEGCTIDLRQGFFSALSETIGFSNGYTSRKTVAIGPNTIIERATSGNGADLLTGNSSSNILSGINGNDTIKGASGDDVLVGGGGKDFLQGDDGKDKFVYTTATQSTANSTTCDIINDFVHLTDVINVSGMDASTAQSGDNTFVFRGGISAFGTSAAGEIRYMQYNNPGTTNDYTAVFFDTDGDATAEFMVKLTNLMPLTAADFLL